MQWSSALDDGQIMGVMSDEGRGLYRGLYWGEETRHGVLDIDAGSKYHDALELRELVRKFAAVGLPLVPYQSSDTGGWHLYFYLTEWAKSEEVEGTIRKYLKANSYSILAGTLEIFPSGNALRLPLQKGFGWLSSDGQLEVRREELTFGQALALFYNDLEENKRNWGEVQSLIERALSSAGAGVAGGAQEREDSVSIEGLEGLYKRGVNWEKWQRGKRYWQDGLTEPNQRHDAILTIGHYLWFGDEAIGLRALPLQRNAGKRAELIKDWLVEKHNGHSEEVIKGRWSEIEADIERAAWWTNQRALISQNQKQYEPYQLTDRLLKRLKWLHKQTGKLFTIEELAKANIERGQDARHRIAVAVAQLEAENQEIDISKVARRAKACHKTVAKHRDLLCSPGGEYIAGGQGGLSGSLLPAVGSETPEEEISVQTYLPLFGESGEAALLNKGVNEASLISSDESQTLKPFSLIELTEFFGFKSEHVDIEPSKFVHDLSVLPSCESTVTIGVGWFKVAPVVSCLAESQPESTQYQAQALRVAAQSLTPGPVVSGIQALRHATPGGTYQWSGERAGSKSRGPPVASN
ncbi:MAG: hypothetical protein BWY75_01072 [bacterium ADurb.Bin425]|nr:MAG: hypothetical protein BWY75_01072 [bacterium ADurb.Bin425]